MFIYNGSNHDNYLNSMIHNHRYCLLGVSSYSIEGFILTVVNSNILPF